MNGHGRLFVLGLGVFGLVSCGDAGSGSTRDTPHQDDSASRENDNGGLMHDDGDGPCSPMPVAWDEFTELEITPEEAFAPWQGSCSATMTWDAAGNSNVAIDPPGGTSQIDVEVNVDPSSATVVVGDGVHCGLSLSADANVLVETADGRFSDEEDVTVDYDAGFGLFPVTFNVAADNLGGDLSVAGRDGADVVFSYRVSPLADGCVGNIELTTSYSTGRSATIVGGTGAFASWSDTGCDVGEVLVALDEPLEDGSTVVGSLEDAFGMTSYPGTWDDGAVADLLISTDFDAAPVCVDALFPNDIQVPARVTYSTSEGRVLEHSVAGSGHVSLRNGAPGSLQLSVDEKATCSDTQSELPYALRGCDTLDHVTLQLRINEQVARGSTETQVLTAYEHYRGGTAAGGAADEVRSWASDEWLHD